MHINQIKESKFLKKEDCGKGILATISHLEQMNVAQAGQPEEMKHCLCFVEEILPMVLNMTNARLIAQITSSEDTDGWPGHQVVLYEDKAVAFAGRITGGIRVRAPRKIPAPAPAPVRPVPAPQYAPAPAQYAASTPVGQPLTRQAPAPAPVAAPSVTDPEDDDVPF